MPFMLFASGRTMNTSDYMFFMNLDKKPFKQEKLTDQQSESVELKRDGKYLIYAISTNNYRLTINALDATVIEKRDIRNNKCD